MANKLRSRGPVRCRKFAGMCAEEGMRKIVEGKAAPDFTLPDAHGAPVTLSGFRGKDVLVFFYPKDDTPG
jgi:cytochrome oxidase Cu insertion factor (SCO1/SenC/PrrC family)